MYTSPGENRIHVDHILLEEFRRKGYKCEEILEDDATIFIIKHERKQSDFNQAMSESYKDFFRTN